MSPNQVLVLLAVAIAMVLVLFYMMTKKSTVVAPSPLPPTTSPLPPTTSPLPPSAFPSAASPSIPSAPLITGPLATPVVAPLTPLGYSNGLPSGFTVPVSVMDMYGNAIKSVKMLVDTGSSIPVIQDNALYVAQAASATNTEAPTTQRYGSQVSVGYFDRNKSFTIGNANLGQLTALMQQQPAALGTYDSISYLLGVAPSIGMAYSTTENFAYQAGLRGMAFDLFNAKTLTMTGSAEDAAAAEAALGTPVATAGLCHLGPYFSSPTQSMVWGFSDGTIDTWAFDGATLTSSASGASIPMDTMSTIYDTGTTAPISFPFNGADANQASSASVTMLTLTVPKTTQYPDQPEVKYRSTFYLPPSEWTTITLRFPAGAVPASSIPVISKATTGPALRMIIGIQALLMNNMNVSFSLDSTAMDAAPAFEQEIFADIATETKVAVPPSFCGMLNMKLFSPSAP